MSCLASKIRTLLASLWILVNFMFLMSVLNGDKRVLCWKPKARPLSQASLYLTIWHRGVTNLFRISQKQSKAFCLRLLCCRGDRKHMAGHMVGDAAELWGHWLPCDSLGQWDLQDSSVRMSSTPFMIAFMSVLTSAICWVISPCRWSTSALHCMHAHLHINHRGLVIIMCSGCMLCMAVKLKRSTFKEALYWFYCKSLYRYWGIQLILCKQFYIFCGSGGAFCSLVGYFSEQTRHMFTMGAWHLTISQNISISARSKQPQNTQMYEHWYKNRAC